MRLGGTEVPITGDIIVYRHASAAGDRFVVRTFANSVEGTTYESHDEAVAAATALAAKAQVSVFYSAPPSSPTLLKPFRTL